MIYVSVNPAQTIQPIKPMHAGGQPPFAGGFRKFDFSYMRHLKHANIPYARLHDVNGAFGGNRFVDIPNIFRDFNADERDPANCDFVFTDQLIAAMYAYDLKPIFRLGVTIENQAIFRALRINPPVDAHKWARVCEQIISYYNEGWADGYHYGIEYWEIWNAGGIFSAVRCDGHASQGVLWRYHQGGRLCQLRLWRHLLSSR